MHDMAIPNRAIGRWCHYDPDAVPAANETKNDTKNDGSTSSSSTSSTSSSTLVVANDSKVETKVSEEKKAISSSSSSSSSMISSLSFSTSSSRYQYLPVLAKHARFAQMKLRDIFGVTLHIDSQYKRLIINESWIIGGEAIRCITKGNHNGTC
jgi:hypothetical protein